MHVQINPPIRLIQSCNALMVILETRWIKLCERYSEKVGLEARTEILKVPQFISSATIFLYVLLRN